MSYSIVQTYSQRLRVSCLFIFSILPVELIELYCAKQEQSSVPPLSMKRMGRRKSTRISSQHRKVFYVHTFSFRYNIVKVVQAN